MPHLNVEISEQAISVAREEAARAGMLLRKWVERRILDAAKRPMSNNHSTDRMEPGKELQYVPLDIDNE